MSPNAAARLALARMGMRGFAVVDATGRWDGRLHLTERTALSSTPLSGCSVLLVRTDGLLYRQTAGRPVAPWLDPQTFPPRPRALDLRARARLSAGVGTTTKNRARSDVAMGLQVRARRVEESRTEGLFDPGE